MKNILTTISILISTCALAQVAIGKTSVTTPSVSLEFGNENKGIVLPWVNGTSNITPYITGYSESDIIENGTLVYDTNDKKVKIKYATGWRDLSVDTTGIVDTTLQNSLNDLPKAKTQIGGTPSTDTTAGILVLADTDKAMILPKVASPHLNIINPAAGMMAYDTVKKQLAVFNGSVWTFWKP